VLILSQIRDVSEKSEFFSPNYMLSQTQLCFFIVLLGWKLEVLVRVLVCKSNMLPILMHQMHISTTQVFSVMLRSKKLEIRKKKCENWKGRRMETKHHKIEPNLSKDRAMPEGDNLSFWDEFTKFTFFSLQFSSYVYFNTKVLSNWAVTALSLFARLTITTAS
jgi:hypothetical protein